MDVVWRPSRMVVGQANITRFMEEHGFKSERELGDYAASHVPQYWEAVEKHFAFEWFQPYTEVLDETDGAPWAKWFRDGFINLTHNCVDRHAKGDRADHVALDWEGEDGTTRQLTYADLHAEVSRLAGALLDEGVEPGDAVGLFMPMVPEAVVGFLAVAKVGGIVVPLQAGFGADAVAARLADVGAKVLLTADGTTRRGEPVLLKPVADEAAEHVSTLEAMFVLKHLGKAANVDMEPGRDLWWSEAVKGQPTDLPSAWTNAEDPFMVLHEAPADDEPPRGLVHVHGGFLVKATQEMAHQVDCHPEDVLLWPTDMGAVTGPWSVVGTLSLGATLVLHEGAVDHPDPGRLWDVVEGHRVSILGVNPAQVRRLVTAGDQWLKKKDLTSLRVLAASGDPWNTEAWMWYFEKIGHARCPIITITGGAAAGVALLAPTPVTPLKPASLGHPAFGVAAAVVDEKGGTRPAGGGGDLVVRRPWPGMTRGIWQDADRYLATYWSRTATTWGQGDLVAVDEEGQWFHLGPSADALEVAGRRVGVAEVEGALVDSGHAAEAAAVGVTDPVKGTVVHAFVVLRPESEKEPRVRDKLADAVAAALGRPVRPVGVHAVPELPRGFDGGLLRQAVEARATGRDVADLSGVANPAALDTIPKVV